MEPLIKCTPGAAAFLLINFARIYIDKLLK